MEAIHYKGFTIEPAPFGGYKYTPDDYDGPEDKRAGMAPTIEDAKGEVSAIVYESEYPNRWTVEHSKTLSPASFDFLSDAMRFAVRWDATPKFTFNAM